MPSKRGLFCSPIVCPCHHLMKPIRLSHVSEEVELSRSVRRLPRAVFIIAHWCVLCSSDTHIMKPVEVRYRCKPLSRKGSRPPLTEPSLSMYDSVTHSTIIYRRCPQWVSMEDVPLKTSRNRASPSTTSRSRRPSSNAWKSGCRSRIEGEAGLFSKPSMSSSRSGAIKPLSF